LDIAEFIDKFQGHLTYYIPKEDAEAVVAMGKEASDSYERIKLMDVYHHFNKGQSAEQLIKDMNNAGYVWFKSPYFERPEYAQ
jgi:hypothetical protein